MIDPRLRTTCSIRVMRFGDCAVKFCPRRDRTSLSKSCALLNLDDASELQNGVKPLINGLNKATRYQARGTSSLEVGSLGWRYQANALIELFSAICVFGKLPNNRLSVQVESHSLEISKHCAFIITSPLVSQSLRILGLDERIGFINQQLKNKTCRRATFLMLF